MWRIKGQRRHGDWMSIPDNFADDDAGTDDLIESDADYEIRAARDADVANNAAMNDSAQQYGSRDISFSSTGASFAVDTGRGCFVFTTDASATAFDPVDFDTDITEDAVVAALHAQRWSEALRKALRLGEFELVAAAVEATAPPEIQSVVSSLSATSPFPSNLIARLLSFFARYGESTPHIELALTWVVALLTVHSSFITKVWVHCFSFLVFFILFVFLLFYIYIYFLTTIFSFFLLFSFLSFQYHAQLLPSLRAITKWMKTSYSFFSKLSTENLSLMEFLSVQGRL